MEPKFLYLKTALRAFAATFICHVLDVDNETGAINGHMVGPISHGVVLQQTLGRGLWGRLGLMSSSASSSFVIKPNETAARPPFPYSSRCPFTRRYSL